MDDKKSSRIEFAIEADGFNKNNWSEYIEWHIAHMILFEKTIKNFLLDANSELKKHQEINGHFENVHE